MKQPAPLTDLCALTRNRARADMSALFLQEAARDEIQDRLMMVNKSFSSVGVVAAFPDLWKGQIDGAHVVEEQETLPLDQARHDLVIHSLGLHWANDPVGQLIQCRRAMKSDGLLLAVALGGQTLHELRACLAEAEVAETGGLSPRVAPMAEVRDLGALLQRAGLALPVADTVPLRVQYTSMWHLMRDLRAMGEANALSARNRTTTRPGILKRAADIYAASFPGDDGSILATFELIVLTGWAPDKSQQKPLRPGSAQARLADALNTDETSLPD
ncbi:methyltransferase domain-containing protein [Tateyamaria omphalii]|uniref:methyltransferase domain-containing protein n=1 Tax=Tateyamaria omphalii TaxID=299262 RepID=UPI001C991A87|nr:methyltransferase domain-containing protein [Tateyamaria omphalii]MBY5933368.1 methyltransferase domain-containing protein [Tateyamaria omphalii]